MSRSSEVGGKISEWNWKALSTEKEINIKEEINEKRETEKQIGNGYR